MSFFYHSRFSIQRLCLLLSQRARKVASPHQSTRSVFRPELRPLEPRLVLNASAELNELGQLLITGTDAAETVHLLVNDLGDLQLRDIDNTVIPIANHPTDAWSPLAQSAVTSGQITFQLGSGDDRLSLELPSSLRVLVVDEAGYDQTSLMLTNRGPVGSATFQIQSEAIVLEQTESTISFVDDRILLKGDVLAGATGRESVIDVGTEGFSVDGRLFLQGSTEFISRGGDVNLGLATVSALHENTDLSFALGKQTGASVSFGGADGSGGELIRNLEFLSAAEIEFSPETISLTGEVRFDDASSDLVIERLVSASRVQIQSDGDVFLRADDAQIGELIVSSGGDIQIVGTLTITDVLSISTEGGSVDFSESDLFLPSSSEVFTITGASRVTLGNIDAEHSALTLGEETSRIGSVEQFDGTRIHVDRLRVSSEGTVDLSSAGNSLRQIDSIITNGDVRLNDSVDDLWVTLIDAGTGMVAIQSARNVTVGSIATMNASLTSIQIDASQGEIMDGSDERVDLIANSGRAVLVSRFGIGATNSIETQLGSLQAAVLQSGSILIVEVDSIQLADVVTEDGEIDIVAGGTVSADRVLSNNINSFDDPFAAGGSLSRDIRLSANGGGDIIVGQIQAMNSADVGLFASDDILKAPRSRVSADDLTLQSENVNADGDIAIDLTTEIQSLKAIVSGVSRGDMIISEVDSLELAADDSESKELSIKTSNGEIFISAANSITIADQRPQTDNGPFAVSDKVIAGGENGRIRLDAGNAAGDLIRMGNGVAIVASQSTLGSVQIDGGAVEFGEQIEIRTGEQVGVARIFSPRPILVPPPTPTDADGNLLPPIEELPEPAEGAFYDSSTIQTNRLVQALGNGGAGILTVGIGHAGELGLTLNIDWGAESDRYQQLDGLVGDEIYDTEHAYTERDILETRLNGRVSETAPLEVRFSVRHHESIVVTGRSISQGSLQGELVESGVVSATDNDNPLRPELGELSSTNTVADNASLTHLNGQARFIIPSLTIPVAFFPVRNVIPEPESFEIVVRNETILAPKGTSIEQSETLASSSVSRDEFFQIRVLSPDPEGDDLASPERLPDDILEGDQLKRLFKNLPDGRYAVEYVLGDGNERTIIEVDVRGGVPIVPGDELDGGFLKLKVIDKESPQDNEGSPEQPTNDDKQPEPSKTKDSAGTGGFSRAERFARLKA